MKIPGFTNLSIPAYADLPSLQRYPNLIQCVTCGSPCRGGQNRRYCTANCKRLGYNTRRRMARYIRKRGRITTSNTTLAGVTTFRTYWADGSVEEHTPEDYYE